MYQKAVRFDQIIDSLIYQNTIPSLPLFILMMLQQLEAKTAIDSSTGLYGHLFENIIKDWIHIISEDGPDLETKLNYLSEFAYSVVGNGQTSVSERDFEVWHENYCEVYNLSLSQRRLFDNLTEIGILTRTGDSIRFKYRYYLNFFVARYMALHIHEEDVIEHLEFCCKTLHHRDSTKTMIFLCHLSKDPIILKRVLETAKSHFADEEEYNLANMPSLLPPESFRPSRLILTGNTPEANRARMLEDADKAERPHGLEETDEIRERERELTDFVAQVNSAQNTMHLCGQILRNFYGSMKGEQQIDLIRTCFGIGLRTLSTIFRVLEDRKEELALGIAEILRHKHPRWNDATIDKRTRQSIQFLTMSITFGLVKQSSNAVGISRLKISFDKFLEAPGTMLSHQVIDLSARLDFFDQFPKSSVLTIADGLERNPFGMELLRLLVWQHFHLFNCQDNRLCQEICARLGINYHHGHFLSPVPKKSSRK